MFSKIKRALNPLTLSRALKIVRRIAARNRPETDKFDRPIALLTRYLGGDVPVTSITPADLAGWYAQLKNKEHDRKPGHKLSPWTVNSYGRLTRAFFNHLVKLGHLEKTPWQVTIGRLPKLHRKDITTGDIEKLVKASSRNVRDRAIVLLLRDSGCRVGELISMTTGNIHFEKQKDGRGKKRRCGYAIVYGAKMDKWRAILFKHEAAKALKLYLAGRPDVRSDAVWLSYDSKPLTTSGVYQMLHRYAKAAGVERFNPHSFRHAKAKMLYKSGVPEPVIQAMLGHDSADVSRQYVQFEADELLAMLYNLPDESYVIEQSPKVSKNGKR